MDNITRDNNIDVIESNKSTKSSFWAFKPIEWLLMVLLLVAPFYHHENYGGTGFQIPNNIVIWFVGGITGFYSLYALFTHRNIYLPRYFLLILAFPLIIFFGSVVVGVELLDIWITRLLYIWGGLLFFFGLFQHQLGQARIDRLLFFVMLSGFLQAIVGFMQMGFVTSLPWLPLNLPAIKGGAPSGMFQQINNQGSFQVTSIMVALWLASRPFIRFGKPWRFGILLVSLACGTFIVIYSGSRIALLALLLALPLMLISRWQLIKKDKSRWWLVGIVIITSIAVASMTGQLGALEKTTNALNSGYSGAARLGMYTVAIDVYKEKPVFGHGIGSFISVWQFAKPKLYVEHPDALLPNALVTHPHNETIFWLIEGGGLAGLGLLLFFIAIFLALKKLPFSRRYAYAGLLVPIVMHTQVELPFYSSSFHWFVFLILLFVVMNPFNRQYIVRLSTAMKSSIKVLSLVGGIAVIVLMSHTMASSYEFKQRLLKKSPLGHPLPTAIRNPFFKHIAASSMMTTLFAESAKKGIDKNVKLYLEWAKEEVKVTPRPVYYQNIVAALYYLKKTERLCVVINEGLSLYPQAKSLLEIQAGYCEVVNKK